MKTVITRKIDGIEIITGFSEQSIDPVETKKVVAVEIKKSGEYLAVAAKQNQMSAAYLAAGQSAIKSKEAKSKGEKETLHNEFTMFNRQAKGYENEVRDLLPALKKKETELRREFAVYFEPRSCEHVKTEAEISNLMDVIAGLNGSGCVDLSGNIIEDNRGVVYCKKSGEKWTVTKIEVLGVGVPVSAKVYGDLTEVDKNAVDFQIEVDAAARLSPAEKMAGRVNGENRAINDASEMRKRLEIQMVETALEDSQVWYQARMEELNVIYG